MFGLYIIIILLLIIFGHIYEKPVLYSIGYVVGLVTLFYKSSYIYIVMRILYYYDDI